MGERISDRAGDGEWPRNHRNDGNVEHAYMVGAVACENCRQVHVDLVDAVGNVFASGSLDFESWLTMSMGVCDDIRRITGQH